MRIEIASRKPVQAMGQRRPLKAGAMPAYGRRRISWFPAVSQEPPADISDADAEMSAPPLEAGRINRIADGLRLLVQVLPLR